MKEVFVDMDWSWWNWYFI